MSHIPFAVYLQVLEQLSIHAPTHPLTHIPVQVPVQPLLQDKSLVMPLIPNNGMFVMEIKPITGSTLCTVALKNSLLERKLLFSME